MELHVLGLMTIPLVSAVAMLVCRGWRRWAAVVALAVTGPAFAIDVYSAFARGYLTGLFTLLTAPMSASLVLPALGAEFLARTRRGSASGSRDDAAAEFPEMPTVVKVGIAGAGLATITAGLGLYGLRDWSGDSGGHWYAFAGFTFLLPLLFTGSYLLAGLVHWALCLAAARAVWGAIRLARSAVRGTPAVTQPVPPPAPMADPLVPPTTESIARVASSHEGISPARDPSAPPNQDGLESAQPDLQAGFKKPGRFD